MFRNNEDQPKQDEEKKSLSIDQEALKEWKNAPEELRERFKKKLKKALETGQPTGEHLRGHTGLYRIKTKRPNYRLVYRWDEGNISIMVLAPREKVYEIMRARIGSTEKK